MGPISLFIYILYLTPAEALGEKYLMLTWGESSWRYIVFVKESIASFVTEESFSEDASK